MSTSYTPPPGPGEAYGPIRLFTVFDTREKMELLNANLKALVDQIEASGLNYQGAWDADTNTPALASGVGTKGDYYLVTVAGTTDLDGVAVWDVGDWAIFNGTVWQKLDNTAIVISVNGQIGAVVLDYTDVGAEAAGVAAGLVTAHETTYNHANYDAHLINTLNPHSVTAGQVGADAAGTAAGLMSTHESTYDHAGYDTHVASSANPHGVTASQVDAIPTIGSSTDNAIALWDGTSGDAVKNSGVTVEDGEAGGTLLNVAAYTSDPASPQDGDVWILNSGGVFLKARVGGTTYAVQLT